MVESFSLAASSLMVIHEHGSDPFLERCVCRVLFEPVLLENFGTKPERSLYLEPFLECVLEGATALQTIQTEIFEPILLPSLGLSLRFNISRLLWATTGDLTDLHGVFAEFPPRFLNTVEEDTLYGFLLLLTVST
jgi:hypothetical protein